jgi:hypothetical protein
VALSVFEDIVLELLERLGVGFELLQVDSWEYLESLVQAGIAGLPGLSLLSPSSRML